MISLSRLCASIGGFPKKRNNNEQDFDIIHYRWHSHCHDLLLRPEVVCRPTVALDSSGRGVVLQVDVKVIA